MNKLHLTSEHHQYMSNHKQTFKKKYKYVVINNSQKFQMK